MYTYSNHAWNDELIFKLKLENEEEKRIQRKHNTHDIDHYVSCLNKTIVEKTEVQLDFDNTLHSEIFQDYERKTKQKIAGTFYSKLCNLEDKIDDCMYSIYSLLDQK